VFKATTSVNRFILQNADKIGSIIYSLFHNGGTMEDKIISKNIRYTIQNLYTQYRTYNVRKSNRHWNKLHSTITIRPNIAATTRMISANLPVLGRIAIQRTYVPAYCYRPSSVVCRSVCRSVCHSSEPCKNGSTDRDAVWVEESGGSKEPCIRWGCRYPMGKGNFKVDWLRGTMV